MCPSRDLRHMKTNRSVDTDSIEVFISEATYNRENGYGRCAHQGSQINVREEQKGNVN